MSDASVNEVKRIHFMDEVRGLAILLMVFYHAFFTFGFIFGVAIAQQLFIFFWPFEAFFAGVFIFICGVSCRLSHNNFKRGLQLLLVALAISAVFWIFFRDQMIYFGILHFLAIGILLFALMRSLLDKIPPVIGLLCCGIMFLLTWWVPVYQGSVFGIKGRLEWRIPSFLNSQLWLYPLGFGDVKSSDYFPILPWIFCLLAGSFFGVWAKIGRIPTWMYKRRIPFLSVLGRHSLLIYIVHQPVIYCLGFILTIIVRSLQ